MIADPQRCLAAVRSRDPRFDGWFITAVVTTGIYCRPSCPAMTPKTENLRFYPGAAAAQRAGYRACRRCRPDASPGSPAWDHRGDVVARAMRAIADGVVDRSGVPGLATRLGYSVRQLERHLRAELGVGPLAIARAQRAQTARIVIETSDLPLSEVAFAAGFASIRNFNDAIRTVFATTPTDLRRRARGGASTRTAPSNGRSRDDALEVGSSLLLRLPFRLPMHPDNLFGHLAATAVPGVEEWRDGAFRRTLRLPHAHAVVALSPDTDHVRCRIALSDLRDLTVAITRCRRLLDLDADPVAVDAHLTTDPVLAPLVARAPGRRVPRTVDARELAVRAVLGQQVSTAAARTHAGRLVAEHGTAIEDPEGGLTHLFPSPSELAELDPASLAMPAGRRGALTGLVTALADGTLDLSIGCDPEQAEVTLRALPGIGPWTTATITMRGLGDPDAFLPGDLGIREAARGLGLPETPGALTRRAACWRPWRAYAVQHLWATLPHPVNRLPDRQESR